MLKKYLSSFLLVAFISCFYAHSDKYRLIWTLNPSATITIGWNKINGDNHRVYYDVIDHGLDTSLYAMSKTPDVLHDFKDMNNAFARLQNLLPNTIYYFVIADNNSISNRFWFKTASNSNSDPVNIISGGDSRNNRAIRKKANIMVSKLRPHAVAFGGDFTDLGWDSEWKDWLNDWQLTISSDGRMYPIIPARGNHEDSNEILEKLFDTNSEVYYAISFSGDLFRIYSLNSEASIAGNQTTWLENDLQSHSNTIWKMAQYHKPMRPHVSDKDEGNNQYLHWAPLFYTHGVNLVIECDAHTVKTTQPIKPDVNGDEGFSVDTLNGTIYMGEGTWGAPLRLNNDNKSWTAYSGKFNQFKWIYIEKSRMEVKTIKIDFDFNINEVNDTYSNVAPLNLNQWQPQETFDSEFTMIKNSEYAYPSIEFISPTNYEQFNGGASISLQVNASDVDGSIVQVNYFANGTFIGSSSTVPFSYNWNAQISDLYEIQAVAIDNEGFSSVISSPRYVIVGQVEKELGSIIYNAKDDVEESEDGSVNLESNDLELGQDNGIFTTDDRTVGLMFRNIKIPPGAIIDSAFIQFYAEENDGGNANLNISIENTVTPTNYESQFNNLSNRNVWNNSISWQPNSWDNNDAQKTPNLKELVQHIIDLSNWEYGNKLSFIIDGNGERSADSYDGSPQNAPRLFVYYKVGDISTNIKEHISSTSAVTIIPNPNNGKFLVEFPDLINESLDIGIYSISGQKCMVKCTRISDQRVLVNLTEKLSSGSYFLISELGKNVYSQKFIVE